MDSLNHIMTASPKMDDDAKQNTDREIWRERPGDPFSDSIHVTQGGGIGINCGGHVIVLPVRELHRRALESRSEVLEQTISLALLQLDMPSKFKEGAARETLSAAISPRAEPGAPECCCAIHHPNHGRCLQCPIHGIKPPEHAKEYATEPASAAPEHAAAPSGGQTYSKADSQESPAGAHLTAAAPDVKGMVRALRNEAAFHHLMYACQQALTSPHGLNLQDAYLANALRWAIRMSHGEDVALEQRLEVSPLLESISSAHARGLAEGLEEAVKEVEWIVPRSQIGMRQRLVHAIRAKIKLLGDNNGA